MMMSAIVRLKAPLFGVCLAGGLFLSGCCNDCDDEVGMRDVSSSHEVIYTSADSSSTRVISDDSLGDKEYDLSGPTTMGSAPGNGATQVTHSGFPRCDSCDVGCRGDACD